jgi:hypothetical protein
MLWPIPLSDLEHFSKMDVEPPLVRPKTRMSDSLATLLSAWLYGILSIGLALKTFWRM